MKKKGHQWTLKLLPEFADIHEYAPTPPDPGINPDPVLIQSSLINRQRFVIKKTLARARYANKVLTHCNKRNKRSGKIIRGINTKDHLIKIQTLIDTAKTHGVSDLMISQASGGPFLILQGKMHGKEVRGHIWSDSRGPVLDIYTGDYKNECGINIMLRVKQFKNLITYDPSLDRAMGKVSSPIGFRPTSPVLAIAPERRPRNPIIPARKPKRAIKVNK